MIVHTRRRSVCRISCGEYMLPLLGVVSSVNISDRFHLGVESKTFLRYLSVLLSRTLPHSSTQGLRKRDPSPFFDPDISQRYCRMLCRSVAQPFLVTVNLRTLLQCSGFCEPFGRCALALA